MRDYGHHGTENSFNEYDEPSELQRKQIVMAGGEEPINLTYAGESGEIARSSTQEAIYNLREYQALHRITMDWEIARNKVSNIKVVGQGAFGQVAKATAMDVQGMPGERTVMIKMTKGLLHHFTLFLNFPY